MLSDETGFDIHTMREALKAGRRFLGANAWKDWIVAEYGASANATTDEAIDEYIRANALVVNHVSGTVAMGKSGSTDKGSGALNPDLTVKGVKGLRVVDASVFVCTISSFRVFVVSLTSLMPTAYYPCRAHHGARVHSRGACGGFGQVRYSYSY